MEINIDNINRFSTVAEATEALAKERGLSGRNTVTLERMTNKMETTTRAWCLTCNKAAIVACDTGHDVMYGAVDALLKFIALASTQDTSAGRGGNNSTNNGQASLTDSDLELLREIHEFFEQTADGSSDASYPNSMANKFEARLGRLIARKEGK